MPLAQNVATFPRVQAPESLAGAAAPMPGPGGSFTLPFDVARPAETTDAAAGPMPKVLIIDDDRGPRESLRFILKYDYEVHLAAGVREGMALLAAHLFDAVILDVRMPERTGLEGLDDIRALDADVSVIMFTGYASLEVACEAFRHLANDFVAKPPDTDAIQATVARNVAGTRARRRQRTVAHELEAMNRRLLAEIEESKAEVAENKNLAALGLASDELIHDMNSPLTVLTCCVDLLQMQLHKLPRKPPDQWDEALQYIQQIKNSLAHCLRLSDLWRQIKGDTSAERTPVNLGEFLRENAGELTLLATTAGVRFALEADGLSKVVLEVDRTQLGRVVHNLVVNAVRACQGRADGRVVVRGRPVGPGMCEFEVADNGVGIPEEQREAVFQPYYSTKGAGSSGLGLAICKRVVEDHAGFMLLESRVGAGSTFTVRLPRRT